MELISRQTFEGRWALLVLGIGFALTLAAYANALRCEFVYDDQYEIVANPYIQQDQYFVKALTSDVWAFHGDRGKAWSNYWRPLFVTWMAVNYRLFGLNVIGWHITNILAHLTVVVLIYFVLRSLGVRPFVRAMVVWLFAVHPTSVESVTWASGIPNLLMSGFLLGSYLCYLRWREGGGPIVCVGGAFLYLCALFSKEGAIAFPAIIFLTEIALAPEGRIRAAALRTAFGRAAIFLVIAVAFMAVRFKILGVMRTLAPGAPGIAGVLATAPEVLTFYLKQMVWPASLGMAYGIRAVNSGNVGLMNFWLPLAVIIVTGRAVVSLWRWNVAYRLGAIWFFCSIALALDIRVFLPEDIVHDRYLYPALFGGLLFIAQRVFDLVRRFAGNRHAARSVCMKLGGAAAILLAFATYRYNQAWANDVTLWQRAVATDPTSANASGEYGESLRKKGRLIDARRELERTLTLNPDARTPHLALGMIAITEKNYSEAETRLRRVLSALPLDAVAREQLALCRQLQGRTREAIILFEEGRTLLPYKRPAYSVNIAVLHKLDGRPRQAISELESIRVDMRQSGDPAVLQGLYFLGELYLEVEDREAAVVAYDEYLAATGGATDARTLELRRLVQITVEQLKGP